ncbi:uncharacterized protein LOC120267575 [Dioscorea cayenensis subsp. rotundata]|uniref:Uncharacterized protein LOC120267575 n=1 Tax=Dioscorea cayennensis subsp. rotundata TaxID=55577 RepID=A0AB40BW76_DIOCR|nr:uncharacterized protein LOC120267575 [Dioscorea cayenensis subsp. rotundata]
MVLSRLTILLILTVLAKISCASSASSSSGSIHDLLRSHGLPGGLLPKSVDSFVMDPATGLLEATLDSPCYAKYDGLVYFDRVVRGNLSFGELRGVVGLSQEELFLWLPVKEIRVSDPGSGVILFDIGMAHKQLSMSLFEEPPDCRPDGTLILGGGQGVLSSKEKASQY